VTTAVKDTSIEVAGRRLNPQVLTEWQLLLTHIEISEGFSFVVLLVPDVDWANACRLALSHSLDALGKSLLTVDFSGPEDFKVYLPGRLLNLNISDRTGAVWLEKTVSETSPSFTDWQDAWHGMVARLNQFRNPLRRHFQVPVVFVGASWIQSLIRETAPDLWSVRTLVTRIRPQDKGSQFHSEIQGSTELHLEGLSIDPDLALRTAARLRQQPDNELALAELLYRAGRGLNARSQWKDAETVLRESLELQRSINTPDQSLASTLLQLAQSLEWQFRFAEAIDLVSEARGLYAGRDYVLGEANCIKILGDIALRQSDHASAQARYEEALPLFRRIGDVSGEANCIGNLGEIAQRRSDDVSAQARFEKALMLFRRIGNLLGEANCIRSLGHIASDRSDLTTAQARYEEALPLFRRIGSLLGEANCIGSLGEIALKRSDPTTAQARYEEALPLFRRVGSVLGEANCILSLGDFALFKGSVTEARARYIEALQLYEQIAEPYSIGWAHVRLARLENDPKARKAHLKAARAAWTSIDRPDLIAELQQEFKTTEND
jgi:tetratricopeptide (TPR) repeat protein